MKSDNPLESLGKDAPINLPTSTEDEIVVAKVNTSALQEPAETRLENGLHEALSGKGARSHAENTGKEKGRNIVTWDGPSDPANPKNWPSRRRWASCVLLSLFNFVGPLSSAIIAPALPTMQTDLRTSDTIGVMFLSIYMLAFSIGPLITSPLSEMYGRLVVLQGSNIFFFIFNTACGFAKTDRQMLAFRFLSGMGGCAAQSIGGAIMGEIFTPLERGKAISVYSIAPLLGPVIGPVCGGLLTQYASWKWCFWVISIFDVFVQFCGIVYLRETYPPVLLRQKRGLLAKETGNQELRTEFDGNRTWSALLQKNMKRPFNMLATQPIVQVMSLYAGYGYGLAFLLSGEAVKPIIIFIVPCHWRC
ncbi:Major facilitator superfamily [Macrophomina phaseolina MS6]|uniref:Major facilitator superfamily n=1 Tax=Macrophomina phaseolina (strain MS6) TaxID=1126212 RepID=K2RLU1_MACPH|nr:Major facilitator superfamily [Macrophomina phaseolina MS6]